MYSFVTPSKYWSLNILVSGLFATAVSTVFSVIIAALIHQPLGFFQGLNLPPFFIISSIIFAPLFESLIVVLLYYVTKIFTSKHQLVFIVTGTVLGWALHYQYGWLSLPHMLFFGISAFQFWYWRQLNNNWIAYAGIVLTHAMINTLAVSLYVL